MPLRTLVDYLLLSAIWGSSFLFMQLAVGDFGAVTTGAARVAIAALVLLPLAVLQGHGTLIRRHWLPLTVVGLLSSGLPALLYSFALLSIPTGLSAILNATTPLFGAVVAAVWLKDRPTGVRVLGLVIGFAGVAVLASGKGSVTPVASGFAPAWAIGACLLACLCYGLAASYTQRHLPGMPPLATAAGSMAGAALVLAGPALATMPARMPSPGAWAALLAVGVVCTGLAYVLYFRLIEAAGPARALTVPYVIPVFAVIYGVAFLGETLTPLMVACALVIGLGTALSTGVLRLPGRPSRRT